VIDAVLNVPTLVKVLASLALILAVNRLAKNLTVSVLAGTLVLGAWSGRPWDALGETAWARFASADNLCLMAVVVLVIWLSSQMAAAGVMRDLVGAVRARTGKRTSMAVLPAVIGVLPMPGGAVFSAPLVDRVDADGTVAPLLKVQANYWFRHIWEYWWPLYPGVLVAVDITKMEIWQFMALQAPLTLFALAAGYAFLLRRIPPEPGNGARPAADGTGAPPPPLLRPLLPVIVVVATYGVVRLAWWGAGHLWPALPPLNKYVPMMVGLVLALATQQVQRPLAWKAWRPILLSRRTAVLVILVAIIRIYGAVIETKMGHAPSLVDEMQAEMDAWGIPALGMIMLLPFVAGITTGICVGFVGASFPIVVSLVGDGNATPELLAAVTLAFGFGYMGMMLSPVHVCLIVTNEHFKTRLARSLRGLLPPAAAVLLAVAAYHVAIRLVGG
jgi:hypothetical protein